ncbi:MAG: CDGSH iron-sulfur domain-containing protein [Marinibacterium profundimaris]
MSDTSSDTITVHWDGKTCIHARRCVLGLPDVFRPGTRGGWIFPEEAPTEEIARVIDACPSGALSYTHHDGGQDEPVPRVNALRTWENGPNEFRADLRIPGEPPRKRTLICRCGASSNMPYCDGSHEKAGFAATGEPDTRDEQAELEARDGPIELTAFEDGPVRVSGNLEIVAASGRRVTTCKSAFLCRCGHSANKPFCDGSHKKAGFTAPATEGTE